MLYISPERHMTTDRLFGPGAYLIRRVNIVCFPSDIAILHALVDESFADDLNKKRGIVRGRVALLLRSSEIRPAVSKIRALYAHLPLLPNIYLTGF